MSFVERLRWISEDPVGFMAGDGNLSRYVHNAPTYLVDPSGLVEDPQETGTPAVPEDEAAYGSKDNAYQGVGKWTFRLYGELWDIWNPMNKEFGWSQGDEENTKWKDQFKRGCVGLCMLRFGYTDPDEKDAPRFPPEIPGAQLFDSLPAAKDALKKSQDDAKKEGRDTEYGLFVWQIPGGKLEPGDVNDDHEVVADIKRLNELTPDNRKSEYNFGTYMEGYRGLTYWEYMDHTFDIRGAGPTAKIDPPSTLFHLPWLPKLSRRGDKYLELYGIAPIKD